MSRKIALIGTASSGAKGPFKDATWECWGVSSRAPYFARADRWFEIHNLNGEPQDWADKWREQMKATLADVPVIYMIYPEPILPSVQRFPVDAMVDRFGSFFMSSTFSWMMAQAIDEMAPLDANGRPTIAPVGSEIAVFGVDMEYGTEYAEQRAGFRHFMELAKSLGIAVTRLTSTGLSYDPIPYPMIQDDPLLAKLAMRTTEAANKRAAYNDSLMRLQEMQASNRAVRTMIGQTMQEGWNPAAVTKMLEDEYEAVDKSIVTISKDLVFLDGTLAEQSWLAGYLRP